MKTTFEKDTVNNEIHATREFAAPLSKTWNAWTQAELLDQWWAPKPWKAQTKTMDFREGGHWLYAMQGPAGEKHWSRADYKKVEKEKSFTGEDYFCDEKGVKNASLPTMNWHVVFEPAGNHTIVRVHIKFSSRQDLEKIIEMGFKEGFESAQDNLDEIFSKVPSA
jgi:uncharacterized protein YndB with AHSA1/START domain